VTTQILDYSWARPSPQSCKDFPAVGVMRYLGPGNNGRDITKAELDSLHSVGLGVGLVWETTAGMALEGYNAGAHHASEASYYAGLLGWPAGMPIYFACDCDVSTSQAYGQVLDFFRGTTTGGYPARAYGEADVLDATAEHLGFRYGWQPAATSWSNNRISPNAGMLQQWPYVMGDQCDNNIVTCPSDLIDWLWNPGAEMPLSQDDLNQIQSIVTNSINKAMNESYTGLRALKAEGDAAAYELVVVDGVLGRRYIDSVGQIQMLQWADYMAGTGQGNIRTITDPVYKDEFQRLPVFPQNAQGTQLHTEGLDETD
jgi:hypothetical protein